MSGISDVQPRVRGQNQLTEQKQGASAPTARAHLSDLGRWGVLLHRWYTRKTLRELDASQLKDIGLTREQARHEGYKPFWRS